MGSLKVAPREQGSGKWVLAPVPRCEVSQRLMCGLMVALADLLKYCMTEVLSTWHLTLGGYYKERPRTAGSTPELIGEW